MLVAIVRRCIITRDLRMTSSVNAIAYFCRPVERGFEMIDTLSSTALRRILIYVASATN
jgi:hypothetical protein